MRQPRQLCGEGPNLGQHIAKRARQAQQIRIKRLAALRGQIETFHQGAEAIARAGHGNAERLKLFLQAAHQDLAALRLGVKAAKIAGDRHREGIRAAKGLKKIRGQIRPLKRDIKLGPAQQIHGVIDAGQTARETREGLCGALTDLGKFLSAQQQLCHLIAGVLHMGGQLALDVLLAFAIGDDFKAGATEVFQRLNG